MPLLQLALNNLEREEGDQRPLLPANSVRDSVCMPKAVFLFQGQEISPGEEGAPTVLPRAKQTEGWSVGACTWDPRKLMAGVAVPPSAARAEWAASAPSL